MVVGDAIMGARITDSGGTDWLLQLSRMRKGSKEIIEKALKAGADILADGFRSEIETLIAACIAGKRAKKENAE